VDVRIDPNVLVVVRVSVIACISVVVAIFTVVITVGGNRARGGVRVLLKTPQCDHHRSNLRRNSHHPPFRGFVLRRELLSCSVLPKPSTKVNR
jgi:hypothetical protein